MILDEGCLHSLNPELCNLEQSLQEMRKERQFSLFTSQSSNLGDFFEKQVVVHFKGHESITTALCVPG